MLSLPSLKAILNFYTIFFKNNIHIIWTIDSFNLQQWVNSPTHTLGHTLDLILTHGLSVTDVMVFDSLISDHFPIMFTMCLPEPSQRKIPTTRQTRAYTLHTFAKISMNFIRKRIFPRCLSRLYLTTMLNIILIFLWYKTLQLPLNLLNKNPNLCLGSIKISCRKAERKWKRDKLQISFDVFKSGLSSYQSASKKAKATYFSTLIEKHHHTPKVQFSTIKPSYYPFSQPLHLTIGGLF